MNRVLKENPAPDEPFTVPDHEWWMEFADAASWTKRGGAVRRKGWPEGAYAIMVVPGQRHRYVTEATGAPEASRDGKPHFALYEPGKGWDAGWQPSTDDMMAEDWVVTRREVA